MKESLLVVSICIAVAGTVQTAEARNLLTNGNLDLTTNVEIVPGFFLPKPAGWQNVGIRTLSGPFEDEMSSEPWAGPAPTPVTTDGAGNSDWAVFFKGFTGNVSTGDLTTGHLYQDVPGVPGARYDLSGWAGIEANYLGGAVFAIDFLDAGSDMIGSAELDLIAAGIFADNGLPFDYKKFTVSAIAPANTVFVRARASIINAAGNPAGGGQAFVVDDFELVPAPSAGALGLMFGLVALRRKR